MRHLRPVTAWGLSYYALLLFSGIFLGEAAYFLWPQLFLFWLRLDSMVAFVTAVLAEGILIFFVGEKVNDSLVQAQHPIPAALAGLGTLAITIGGLLFVAWNVAEFMDWPIAP
jgi:hypothetical protein